MTKIRIAILGCGRMGKRHAQQYKKHPNVKIKGFYDLQKKLAKNLASEYCALTYSTIDSVMNDTEIDAVSICTPNVFHFEILKTAIKSGKNVLVEKPIVTTSEHCDVIFNLMKRSSSKIMVGHINRFFPCNIALKSILESGKVGLPKIINTFDYIPGRIPGEKMPTWVKSKKFSGGGVFMTDLVHTVDKIAWLTNSRIKKVFAPTLLNFITGKKVEDAGVAMLWLENGITASCIHGCPSPGEYDMSIKIMCTKGEVSLQFPEKLQIFKDLIDTKPTYGSYKKQSSTAFSSEINEFVNSILEDREPSVNYRDGIRAVRVILALYQSYKRSQPVLVND